MTRKQITITDTEILHNQILDTLAQLKQQYLIAQTELGVDRDTTVTRLATVDTVRTRINDIFLKNDPQYQNAIAAMEAWAKLELEG